MKPLQRTTFRRYSLWLEVSALLLTFIILFVAVWFTLAEINRKYLDLRLADAAKVELFLNNYLDDARQSLETFVNLAETEPSPKVLQLFAIFSDIYHLDPQLRVQRIHKATPGSKVFIGFSFSTGKLADYLKSVGERHAVSEIMRGYEDDAPSVYFAIGSEHGGYLGRLDIAYLQNFLIQFSRFSGTPVMLVARDGFVMLSGDPALPIPAFDLKKWAGPPSASRTLSAGDRDWIPIISDMGAIGTRIVTLIPTELLEAQRNALLGFLVVFMGGLIVLVVLKNRRLNRLVIQPLAAFAGRMRDLEKGRLLAIDDDRADRFEELADIHTRFRAMVEAIRDREQSLRESEQKFRLAFDNANTGMCLVDPQGQLLQVNDKMSAIFGYSRGELEHMTVNDLTVPEDLELSLTFIHHAIEGTADRILFEKRYRHRQGHIIDGQVASSLVRDAQGRPRYFISQVQDITERKRAEAALVLAKQEADAANRAKSVFLANMSHEIRTPLNAILGFAQVLGRDPDLNDAQRASLTTIQRSGDHLLTLINDILDMAKIEAGRMTLQTAPFDLAKLLTETEGLFQQRARDRGLFLTVEASALPQRVDGDEMKLRQVLINLIGNAIKFTPTGSVTLRVEKAGGDAIRFSIIDTGMGIAPDERARLFTPFTQTESGRSTQGGTGLGLALSSQFVRLMQGELSVDSAPGQGSCFSFILLLPPVAGPELADVPTGDSIVGLEPGQPICRILIVDDLPDNREPLRALLNTLNPQPPVLEFREAANGEEAIAIWAGWQPQLIFMDMRMPVLSGEEATRRIKARMAAQPAAVRSVIVALTASAFDTNRDRFLACGCDEFAGKPFRAEELFAILERFTALRFVRAAERPAREERLSAEGVTTHLIVCPEQWRAALKDAVRLGDFGRITELVEQIGDHDAALQRVLSQWAYHYDLEAFTQALKGALPHDSQS